MAKTDKTKGQEQGELTAKGFIKRLEALRTPQAAKVLAISHLTRKM